MKRRITTLVLAIASLFICARAFSEEVGARTDAGLVLPTKQLVRPAGKSVEFNGRPVDLLLSPNGKTVYVKDNRGLVVIDAIEWKIIQETSYPQKGKPSAHGMAITGDGSTLYVATALNMLLEAKIEADGKVAWGRSIKLPGGAAGGNPSPCGIALSADEKTAYVCLSRNNTLAIVDLVAGALVKEIPVGVAPYDVALSPDGSTAYVSNWGGRRPRDGEKTENSSGTDTLVDARGIASSGTLSIVDLKQGREATQIATGLHPSDVKVRHDGRAVFVANANSDTVSMIDTRKRVVRETISVRPDRSLPFGSLSNALELSADGKTLYVANGGNNAVAVVAVDGKHSKTRGFIPTAWYPGAVVTDGRSLYIANVKGWGSRSRSSGSKGWIVHSPLGTVTKVDIPSAATLKQYTAQVRKDSRVPQALLAMEKAATGKKPAPVPLALGDPSVFEHVVYIIKENKTYDQVFGDIGRGQSEPSLCVYGREVSPNHHALAEQFVLLDNYYCNGVCSADGHAWVSQGIATDYLEKSFIGWSRSYPFGGDDCLAVASSGMIWDNVISNGLSFRNYGEMNTTSIPKGATWADCYNDYLNGTRKVPFTHAIHFDPLRLYSCPDYPGWNLRIPDVQRAEIFLKEFREYEKSGDWPNFVIVYLPVDHTTGGSLGYPVPRAQMADNDLALGRIVEAISKSRFWPRTAIFVEEDDPQSGFDHIDGHRSLCLVISPYTKRNALISEFYNQTSVLHTMERILGIPPMNQMDAMSTLMTDCFTDKPDFTRYTCLPNQVPLDEMPKKTALNFGDGKSFSKDGKSDPFAAPDIIVDDKLNRATWAMARGLNVPYPAHLAGAHGAGLKALQLKLAPDGDDDD